MALAPIISIMWLCGKIARSVTEPVFVISCDTEKLSPPRFLKIIAYGFFAIVKQAGAHLLQEAEF